MQNKETGEVLMTTPFSQQLGHLGRGTLDFELTEKLAQLIRAVRETGKKGSITLKLDVAKLNGRDENAVKIVPAIKLTTPELAPYESVMYSTADGDLLRDDPRQQKLELREVPRAPVAAPIVVAAPAAAAPIVPTQSA